MNQPWSIQITYDYTDDDGKKHRTRSVYHVTADNIGEAYRLTAEEMGPSYKLGSILPGHHNGVF